MRISARSVVLFALLAVLALFAAATAASRNAASRAEATPAAQPPAKAPASAFGPAPALTSVARAAASRVTRVTGPARGSERPPAEPRLFLARVKPGRVVAVRSAPGGRVRARLGALTRFGSPQVLGVSAVRGRWLGVATTARPDGRVGWIDRRSAAIRVVPTRISLTIDLSERRLELRRGDRLVRRARVAVGRPGSRTPTGRFSITDKLDGRRFSPYYGCCILALSGEQPNPPPGWTGGNRLAIHGTNAPGLIGKASSAGCLRAADGDLRVLMRRVPLGTPVHVVA